MNLEQARLELDATTLRPQDASEEALEVARKNAALRAWLVKRTAFDEKVADVSSAGVEVPDATIFTERP